jgi:glycosyltransferase involved in cell wall biosynthesis
MLNVLPLWRVGRAARVVTIHDLAFLLFDDKHSPAQRRYLEISTRAAVRRAERIIAVSENTRQDILRLLHVSPDKVVTISEAAGSEFAPLPSAEVEAFRARRALPNRFFFYLGTLEPRKNIPALLRGYALMRQQEPNAPVLIIAGPKGWLYDEIFTLVRELQLEPFVSFPGFIPRDELALWFNAALCFIYLSEYEGFGLPPLQAMACGIPPIINNASSLPEVVGDAGILVNVHDLADVAGSLRRMACDEAKRLELGQKALERSHTFSWQRAARETLKIYQAVHAEAR